MKILILFSMFMVSTIANCGNVVGSWSHHYDEFRDINDSVSVRTVINVNYTFNTDGTFTMTEKSTIGNKHSENIITGSYVLKTDILYLKLKGAENYFKYKLYWITVVNKSAIYIEAKDFYLTVIKDN